MFPFPLDDVHIVTDENGIAATGNVDEITMRYFNRQIANNEICASGGGFDDGENTYDEPRLKVDNNIREYAEEYPVQIEFDKKRQRYVIIALNEGGYNSTSVDLVDLLEYVKEKMPGLKNLKGTKNEIFY